MNTFRTAFAPAILATLAACSGSSSTSNAGPAPASFALHVDTGAGGTDLLSVRLAAAFLESADGSTTANLLPAATELVLVDPTGDAAGLALVPPSRGPFVALHLVVEGPSALARRADGTSATVALPGADLRVPIPGMFSPTASGSLVVGHSAAPSLMPGSGRGMRWTPALSGRQTESFAFACSSAAVVGVHLAERSITVMVPAYQDLAFDLVIDDTTRLVGPDGRSHGVDDLLRSCGIGATLSWDAFREGDRVLRCRSLYLHGQHGGDGYVGRIASLDPIARSFELDVQARMMRGGYGSAPTARLTIDASAAVIYAGHRSTRTTAVFGDLAVGGLVDVDGSAPANGVVVARSVEIEDGRHGGGAMAGEIQGLVTGVDTVAGTMQIGPRGNDPLIVGGNAVTSATVVTDASTAIYRHESGGLRAIDLPAVTTADRVWILGEVTGPQAVRATWIRVEADH